MYSIPADRSVSVNRFQKGKEKQYDQVVQQRMKVESTKYENKQKQAVQTKNKLNWEHEQMLVSWSLLFASFRVFLLSSVFISVLVFS